MRWRSGRRSRNVEDRRGFRVSRRVAGGGIGTIVIALIALYLGVDPSVIINQNQSVQRCGEMVSTSQQHRGSPTENHLVDFISVVLAETEDTWREIFRRMNRTYREPTLVLFSGAVESACGFAQSATGPFYCPADEKIYIDLSFYQDLKQRFHAPGDFAQVYVIAHEIGHHVQTVLGIFTKVHQLRSRLSKEKSNQLSVMMELQTDCFSGIWTFWTMVSIASRRTAWWSIEPAPLRMKFLVPDSLTPRGMSMRRAVGPARSTA